MKIKKGIAVPETSLEAVEQLHEFFRTDLWYALGSELKTEKQMMKYLNTFFGICIKQIKRIEE